MCGFSAVATASGLAAQLVAVLCIAQAGDHLVASASLYGGTVTQFTVTLKRMGISCTLVGGDDPQALAAAIRHGVSTALLWVTVVGLLSLLFAFLFTGAAVRSITWPLKRITSAAETLASGDVDVDYVDIESRDEIGQMARAFSSLVEYRDAMTTAAREIASQGRDATGVRVMNLDDGQSVAAVARVTAENESD